MVDETRPLHIGSFGFLIGGAGFLYCWFIPQMVGETRPYTSVLLDFWLGGRFFILLVYGRDGW
jgi:hypothetical protein